MGVKTPIAHRRFLNSVQTQGRQWYRIAAKAEADATDVWIFDEIGYFGVTASDFIDEIKGIESPRINLMVASPGGDVFDGIAIYNALRTHDARINVRVDSLAASIASVIVQAGDTRSMVSGSQMMIHKAWTLAIGSADDLRTTAEVLDVQDEIISEIYAERSGGDAADFLALMADEKWMKAAEAVELGLADQVITPDVQDEDQETDDDDTGDEEEDLAAAKAAFLESMNVS